ncbi:5'-methylthioadenosine phosphorylase, partial [Methanosarcinales archaeon]
MSSLGIIGGTNFLAKSLFLFERVEEREIVTEYGSVPVVLKDEEIAFIQRHGRHH